MGNASRRFTRKRPWVWLLIGLACGYCLFSALTHQGSTPVPTFVKTPSPGPTVTPTASRTFQASPTENQRVLPAIPLGTAIPTPVNTPEPVRRPTQTPQPSPTPSTIQTGCAGGCTSQLPGCDIKGNISYKSGEKIYHVPGGDFYDATVINPKYGERWFCTEEEAVTAGWRRSLR